MGQFTSLCIILAWGGQVHLLCIILILLCAVASTKHLLCSVFWFYTCVCVCVCRGGGRGWPCCMTFGILVLWPRIEPGPTAVKTLRPSHWTAKRFPEHSFCFYLCVHFQLPWVFAAAHRFSLAAVRGLLSSCGVQASHCRGLSGCGVQAPGTQASVVAARGPSCSTACEILPDRGSNPRPLHWQTDS